MAFTKKTRGGASFGKGGKGGKGGSRDRDDQPSNSRKPAGKRSSTGGPRRFEKHNDERAPRRFEKHNDERAPRRFEKHNDERAPRRFEKHNDERAPRRFERNNDERAPRRFEKHNDERAPRRFEKHNDERAPRRFEKHNDERAPRRFEKRNDERAPRRFEKHNDAAPKRFSEDFANERPKRPALGLKPEREKKAFTPHEFFIWGRRPVEAYLAELSAEGSEPDVKQHKLHIIVDKAGKAPAQLRAIVELVKSYGFPMATHKSEDEEWPIQGEEGLNHQRVCLRVPAIRQHSIEDLVSVASAAKENGVHGCIGVVCDQIQDPRNFGAILRSAAFFGLQFAIYGKDRQALITPHVLKASAGGAFQLKLVEVVNIVRSLESLKKAGVWVVGAALENSVSLSEVPVDRPYVVVLGNEAKGLRQEVARHCDYLARIGGGSVTVDSLNVAVAAGVVFHALKANAPAVDE